MDKMRRERESDWFGLSFCFPPVVMKANFPKRRRQKTWCPRSLDSEVLDMKFLTYPVHGTQSSQTNTFLIKKKKKSFSFAKFWTFWFELISNLWKSWKNSTTQNPQILTLYHTYILILSLENVHILNVCLYTYFYYFLNHLRVSWRHGAT